VNEMLTWIDGLPSALVYLALSLGAALENIVPAVPADTFVALGGLLASVGRLDWRWILALTWSANVGSALVTYRLGYTHGRPFFEHGWGVRVLNARQMERMAAFYDRWGIWAILVTRFLPGLRSVVPVFAGVTHQPFLFVALPIAAASLVWHAGLIWIGFTIGRNLDALSSTLGAAQTLLLSVAAGVAALIVAWWWRTRRTSDE